MKKVTVYTSDYCPYCVQAKRLLDRKGAAYEEINISEDEARRGEMIARTKGRMSVPQIFIGDVHVGGSDDLHELERAGKLDPLLNAGGR
jgi:glutaredoxin 3